MLKVYAAAALVTALSGSYLYAKWRIDTLTEENSSLQRDNATQGMALGHLSQELQRTFAIAEAERQQVKAKHLQISQLQRHSRELNDALQQSAQHDQALRDCIELPAPDNFTDSLLRYARGQGGAQGDAGVPSPDPVRRPDTADAARG